MGEFILEKNINVKYSEMDYDLVLKPACLMQYMQDLASDSAESMDFGYSFVVQNNLAWFLLKYHMEFVDYPKGLYDLTLKTEPRGYNRLFAFRDFALFSADKCIAKMTSTWGLVDMKNKTMQNAQEFLGNNPNISPFVKRDSDLSYNKIKPLEKVDLEKIFEIRFDDLDVNQHVNNTNYIVWAFEPLSFEFRSEYKLKTLDMLFKKEISYGAKVLSQIEIQNDTTLHSVKNALTNEELCVISANWVKK